jgi:hypothetical protein
MNHLALFKCKRILVELKHFGKTQNLPQITGIKYIHFFQKKMKIEILFLTFRHFLKYFYSCNLAQLLIFANV